MPNKNKEKGVRKERKIVNQLKAEGFDIAQRSADSRSPIDIFAIHRDKHLIRFIQSKPDSLSKPAKQRIIDEMNYINENIWQVRFVLL